MPAGAPAGASSDNGLKARKRSAVDSDLGQVLRSVYQKAVEEQIPPEMLDLLSKLD